MAEDMKKVRSMNVVGRRTACRHSRQLPFHHSQHMVGAKYDEQMDMRSLAGSHAHLTTTLSRVSASLQRGSALSASSPMDERAEVQADQHGTSSISQQLEQK